KPLVFLGVIVAVAVVAYIGLNFFLGSVVKAGVNSFGPKLTQTKVELAIAYLNWAAAAQTMEERQERLGLARTKAEEAIRIAPHLGSPYYYRGLVEMSSVLPNDPNASQAFQTALAYFQQAHRLGCQEPQLFEQLALLYAQMGRTPEMLSFAERGTLRSPEDPATWMFLARAYLTVGRNDEAIQACDRALTVSNNAPQVLDFSNRVRQAIEEAKQK
ncbi:MAG TPA: hypothetical protein P5218_08690, partial [Planctomycetota bacterium]|nr:hypothetical protein [Planctomycetota bacterium]